MTKPAKSGSKPKKSAQSKKAGGAKKGSGLREKAAQLAAAPPGDGTGAEILDRLWGVVMQRRSADPSVSHSARLLSRGTAKVAQKFGEEAVECLIEAVAKNPAELVAESADVLYHLVVMWVAAGVEPQEVWAELHRREGVSGVEEKAARGAVKTKKIP